MKRAKPDAKSDDFGAVWTQVRRLSRLLEACKTRCKKRRFWRGLPSGARWVAGVVRKHAPGVGTKVNRNGERKRSSVITVLLNAL